MAGLKVGLVGCGSIGKVIADFLETGDDFSLFAIFDKDQKRAREFSGDLKGKPKVVRSIGGMAGCGLIIEAASAEAVRQIAIQALGISDLMIMSSGALSDDAFLTDLKRAAKENGRKVYVPSGAIAGLDGIKSASIGRLESVTLTTRKPPLAFEGSPYVTKNDISLRGIKKPTVLFEGPAKEAVEWFPQNVNVSSSLSLAGIGTSKTQVKVVADPFLERNTHEIEARGDFGSMKVVLENVPSHDNPKTSLLAAFSALATLKKISENLIIGT